MEEFDFLRKSKVHLNNWKVKKKIMRDLFV